MNKPILDVCCGSKMFYFDKNDKRVHFNDLRELEDTLCDGRQIEIKPDTKYDFTKLPFEDNSFYQVVFDPPHLVAGANSWLAIKYGRLLEGWRQTLAKGFEECFRVLKPNGTLIFKWNDTSFPVSEILKLTDKKPVFGHKVGRLNKTHWLSFIKEYNNSDND